MKKLLSIFLALTMVLSLAAVYPINAVEMESEPILSDGQDEPAIQNANEESGEWKEDEEAENDKTLAELENGEEVQNNEALGELENNEEVENDETLAKWLDDETIVEPKYSSIDDISFVNEPINDSYISKSSFKYIRWDSVKGAVGYRLTIVNGNTGELYTPERNMWLGDKTKYNISSILDDIPNYPLLKIWVGAMSSTTGMDVVDTDIVWVTLAEKPEFTNNGHSNVTSNSATLKLTIDRNYGSAIEDAGFYIGTSSYKSRATLYSFDGKYGSGVVNSGSMTMTVTGLEPNTKYYYWGFAENGVGKRTESSYDYGTFTTSSDSSSLTLSDDKVTLNWNDTTKDYVKVSESGFTYQINYPSSVVSSAGDFDYEWIECSQSGSKLYFKATRPNYSDNPRSVEITVTSGNSSAVLTVEQKKCGEGAPSLKIKRDGKTLSDGSNIGSFTLPQSSIDLSVTKSGIRKIAAQLWDSSNNKVDESTSLSSISLDTSKCKAGDYRIDIYASNSDYPNDFWSQRPFSKMTVYFTLSGGESQFNHKPTISIRVEGNGEYIVGDMIKLHITANYTDHLYLNTNSGNLLFKAPDGNMRSNVTFVEESSPSSYPYKTYKNGVEFVVSIYVKGWFENSTEIYCKVTDGVYDGGGGNIGAKYPPEEASIFINFKESSSSVNTGTGKSPAPNIFTDEEWRKLTNFEEFDKTFSEKTAGKILSGYEEYVKNAIKYHITSKDSTSSNPNNPYRTAQNLLGKCQPSADGNAIFFFDGVSANLAGSTATENGYYKGGITYNTSAVCIVVRLNKDGFPVVVYATKDSTTMADTVRFDKVGETVSTNPYKRNWKILWRPTVKDGAYSIYCINHNVMSSIAMAGPSVVRCTQTSYKEDANVAGIHIHRRWSEGVARVPQSAYDKPDSTGCFTIGLYNGDGYSEFIEAATGRKNGLTQKWNNVTSVPSNNYHNMFSYWNWKNCGIVIIDRSNYKVQMNTIFGGKEKSDSQTIVNLITAGSERWHSDIVKYSPPISKEAVVAYDYNDGSGRVEVVQKIIGEGLRIASGSPTHSIITMALAGGTNAESSPPLEFDYWMDEKGQIYMPGDLYTYDEDLYLTGQWNCITADDPNLYYIVTYDANGGQDAPDTQNKEEGVNLKLTRRIPHRSGYTFVGWATSSNSSSVKYYPGDKYKKDESITLYAIWQEIIPDPDPGFDDPVCDDPEPADPELPTIKRGDVNGDGKLNNKDAIWLMMNIISPDEYPINQNGDMDGSGKLNNKDAIHLMMHIISSEEYPLNN